jgi:hypothetical protein
MNQTIEWLSVIVVNNFLSNCMVGFVCVCVMCMWLLKGFVKSDIWIWSIEAQKNEVAEL